MATLTETAYYARKAIKYGSIGLVFLLIFRSLFFTFKTYWKKTHPLPPPKPTVRFGKLPKLIFPERTGLPPLTFRLETISGSLPKLATQAKVFFIPKPSKAILVWENTKTWAKSLGFEQAPEEIGPYDYSFTSRAMPKTTLKVNVLSRNFHLSYDWKNDLELTSQYSPLSESQAVSTVKGFLQQAACLTEDLAAGPAEVIYLKYADGNLAKALFTSEANFAKVNLFRKEIDNIKILPPNPKDGNVTALISASYPLHGGIIELNYIHSPISESNLATYPLTEINQVWTQLIKGKGFVAHLGNNPEGKITIRNAYLAYYDSDTPQDFLQPVFVFEGDNDFYAYISAISDSWLVQ